MAAGATLALLLGSLAASNNWWGASEWMPASRRAVFEDGQIWRLWTTLFVHADFHHFLSNTLLFFILGFFLYGYFGWRIFPLGSLMGGALTDAIVLPTYEPEMRLIGASGIVYLMGGLWLTFYFYLSRQKNLTQRVLRSVGVAVLLFMPAEAFDPSISYRTHFVGFVIGVLMGNWHYWRRRTLFKSAERIETIIEEG